MASRTISTTQTLEDFRLEFNALSSQDFGDIGLLSNQIASRNIVGAMNELIGLVTNAQGFTIIDTDNNSQIVGPGQTITFSGTDGQIDATVSATDTVTFSFPTNSVTIPNNLLVNNILQVDNTLQLSSGSITDSSGEIDFANEDLTTTGDLTAGTTTLGATTATSITSNSYNVGTTGTIIFEGATDDANEISLVSEDASADRTITIPDVTGTLITTGDVGTITGTMIQNGSITNDDIQNSTIRASKLNLASDTLIANVVQANSFIGTINASTISLSDANNANASFYVPFAPSATGSQALRTDGGITYNPNTNVLNVIASSARYADLAEVYTSDEKYAPGTVVMFGGDEEVTISEERTKAVAGVVSTKPAYLMNSELENTGKVTVALALQGRVPCKVKGFIKKGDMLVASDEPGVATSDDDPISGTVIGKSLENYDSEEVSVIEVVIGRL